MIDSKERCVSVIENQILIYKTKGELTDRQTQITTEMLFAYQANCKVSLIR